MSWLLDNWRIIVEAIALITSIVLFLLRKKPVKIVDSVKSVIIEALPTLIERVENYKDVFNPDRKLSGDEKLQMVIHACYTLMVDELGIPENDLPSYTPHLIEWIEAILATPQKKGEKDEN